jgi:hypothetical protein
VFFFLFFAELVEYYIFYLWRGRGQDKRPAWGPVGYGERLKVSKGEVKPRVMREEGNVRRRVE